MSNLKNVTEASFEADVMANSQPVLIDLWAEWCGPCKALAPTLEKVSENFKGKVDFVKVNVDEHPAVQRRFGVRGIPTLILVKGGQEIGRVVGNRSATQLAGFLDAHLGTVTELARPNITLSAFGGDAEAKAKHIGRLREHIARKQAAPDEEMWPAHINSALGFLANSADPDDAARVLGIPTQVVSTVEVLSSYRGTHIAGERFIAEWLDTVPVGADLTKLPSRLLSAILTSRLVSDALGDDSVLLGIRDELLTLHGAEAQGATPADSSWASVKQACANAASEPGDANRATAANMLGAASSSIAKDPDMLNGFIFSVSSIVWNRLKAVYSWGQDDEGRFARLADSIMKCAVEQGIEPPYGDAMLAQIEEVDADLARRFRSQYHEGTRALSERGHAIGDMLVDLTKRFH